MVSQETQPQGLRVWREFRRRSCSQRRQVTGHARLEVGQPEPATSLPAHAGLKVGLEVTKGSDKAEQECGVGRVEAEWLKAGGPPWGRVPRWGWLALQGQAPGTLESRATCRGSVRDAPAAQPMARRRRRAGWGRTAEGRATGCAALTHLVYGPRTGSGRPPSPVRGRAAAAAPGPGPPSAGLLPAPCSRSPHRPRPGTGGARAGPRFYPGARAQRPGAGPTHLPRRPRLRVP